MYVAPTSSAGRGSGMRMRTINFPSGSVMREMRERRGDRGTCISNYSLKVVSTARRTGRDEGRAFAIRTDWHALVSSYLRIILCSARSIRTAARLHTYQTLVVVTFAFSDEEDIDLSTNPTSFYISVLLPRLNADAGRQDFEIAMAQKTRAPKGRKRNESRGLLLLVICIKHTASYSLPLPRPPCRDSKHDTYGSIWRQTNSSLQFNPQAWEH